MQEDEVPPQVVADDQRVMPDWIPGEPEVLQHDHGVSGGHLVKQHLEIGNRIGNPSMTTRSSDDGGLIAPLKCWCKHFFCQSAGGHPQSAPYKRHGQGGRAALVILLRVKRHRMNFGTLGQMIRSRCPIHERAAAATAEEEAEHQQRHRQGAEPPRDDN